MRPDERMGPKFLAYHDVLAAAGGDETRALSGFRRHFSAIAEMGYDFVPMSRFLSGGKLRSRDVVVTVDDGARSFVTCMLPVLREFGVSATLFVLTGFAGLHGNGVDFLTWDELAELAAEGVEIGCHGVGHVPFDQVDSARMRAEVTDATEAMRVRGFAPGAFAYPFGRYDAATKQVVEAAGYSAAFTVMRGGYDRYEIRRRLFTGLENPLLTRFIMGDHYFEIREAARSVTPRRFLRQEQPIAPERWGPEAFGVKS